jgi:hypothetical protein
VLRLTLGRPAQLLHGLARARELPPRRQSLERGIGSQFSVLSSQKSVVRGQLSVVRGLAG